MSFSMKIIVLFVVLQSITLLIFTSPSHCDVGDSENSILRNVPLKNYDEIIDKNACYTFGKYRLHFLMFLDNDNNPELENDVLELLNKVENFETGKMIKCDESVGIVSKIYKTTWPDVAMCKCYSGSNWNLQFVNLNTCDVLSDIALHTFEVDVLPQRMIQHSKCTKMAQDNEYNTLKVSHHCWSAMVYAMNHGKLTLLETESLQKTQKKTGIAFQGGHRIDHAGTKQAKNFGPAPSLY